jgi:hypothetical protein
MAYAVTNTYPGRSIMWNRMKGAGAEPKNLKWGTGGGFTGAANPNVALFAPATEAPVAGTSALLTTTGLADTYQVIGTITCAVAGKTITEEVWSDSLTLSSTGTLASTLTAAATSMTLGAALGITASNFYAQIGNETVLVTGANSATLSISRGQLGSTSATAAVGTPVTIGGDGGAGTGGATSGQTATVGAAQGGNIFVHADFAGDALNVNDSLTSTLTVTLT